MDSSEPRPRTAIQKLCASPKSPLAWPLLVAGSVSVQESPFRSMFDERCQRLGDAADFGSFGRVRELLKDVWHINDAAALGGKLAGVHWRDVMQQKGWDCLLI